MLPVILLFLGLLPALPLDASKACVYPAEVLWMSLKRNGINYRIAHYQLMFIIEQAGISRVATTTERDHAWNLGDVFVQSE
jgi:hypothetical protein